jgi:hypothetical protein
MSKLLTLSEAAAMLNGKLTAGSLRRMARQGKLQLIRVAGKDFTTEEFLNAMVASATVMVSSSPCPEPDCTSAVVATTEPASGSLSTERVKLAQAQARMSVEKLKQRSKPISPKTTGRRVVRIDRPTS